MSGFDESHASAAVFLPQPLLMVRYLLRWIPIAVLVGIAGGSSSALLLWSLDWATRMRTSHGWLIALLPVAGLVVGLLYRYLGSAVEAGNNLILDEIHNEVEEPQRTVPFRMAPLVLVGTFLTHLFGGSAGREGTAVQAAAALADQLGPWFKVDARARRILLMCGISAGFGSVFGTPLSGAVFGLEVLAIGMVEYEAIAPCFVAAFVGDLTTRAWGINHFVYRVTDTPRMTATGLVQAALAGVAFGLAAMLFAQLTHWIGNGFRRVLRWSPLRPMVGGAVVAAAVFAMHTTRYIGLGLPTIVESFAVREPGHVWLLKLLFTAVTLGAGFKGGEVTPLFFIGAALGSALSGVIGLPTSLLAGMGLVAVFAGAANTPIASSLMAMELFGAEAGAYAAIACVFSYLFSGHAGIYTSQRVSVGKDGAAVEPEVGAFSRYSAGAQEAAERAAMVDRERAQMRDTANRPDERK
jgi:H+/Cl- antiporter ClcA